MYSSKYLIFVLGILLLNSLASAEKVFYPNSTGGYGFSESKVGAFGDTEPDATAISQNGLNNISQQTSSPNKLIIGAGDTSTYAGWQVFFPVNASIGSNDLNIDFYIDIRHPSTGHGNLYVDFWNYETEAWVNFGTYLNRANGQSVRGTLKIDSSIASQYINGTTARVRYYGKPVENTIEFWFYYTRIEVGKRYYPNSKAQLAYYESTDTPFSNSEPDATAYTTEQLDIISTNDADYITASGNVYYVGHRVRINAKNGSQLNITVKYQGFPAVSGTVENKYQAWNCSSSSYYTFSTSTSTSLETKNFNTTDTKDFICNGTVLLRVQTNLTPGFKATIGNLYFIEANVDGVSYYPNSNNRAWRAGKTSMWSNTQPDTINYTKLEIDTISADDGNTVIQQGNLGTPTYQGHRIKMLIDEDENDLEEIRISTAVSLFNGASGQVKGFIQVFNDSSGSWINLTTGIPGGLNGLYRFTLTNDLKDYINSNGEIYIRAWADSEGVFGSTFMVAQIDFVEVQVLKSVQTNCWTFINNLLEIPNTCGLIDWDELALEVFG